MRWPWKPLNEAHRPLGTIHMDLHWDIKGLETLRYTYRGADKSLARPGRKQATATEDFEFHIPYL
jgi:hypothetical protein